MVAPAYDAFVKLGPVWKSWLARALPQIRGPRVLRPGGRLVLIDVGYPDDENKEARTNPSRLRLYYSETGSMSAAALSGNAHA